MPASALTAPSPPPSPSTALPGARLREDLTYHPREQGGEVSFLVKDPIRAQFFRFNELQVAAMKLLDGTRPDEEIARRMSAEFDVELPAAQVARLREQLRDRLLLDIESYRLDEGKVLRRFRRLLRLRGLLSLVRDSPLPAHPEAAFPMREGLHELEHGDPGRAAGCFRAVLSHEPDHPPARLALAKLHQAFFEAHREAPAGLWMFPLWNPDRFLTRLEQLMGRWVLSRWGAVLGGVLLLLALQSLRHFRLVPLESIRLTDFLLALALTVPFRITHELAHGLACKHYGGTVPEIGLLVLHGVIPGLYCDVSDSYLCTRRRQKVVIQLVGGLAELMMVCVALLVYVYGPHPRPWSNALLLVIPWRTWSALYNWAPFAKLDGYYALADALGIPNLRDRSLRYLSQRLRHWLLRIPPDSVPLTARERRIFSWYGSSAVIFSVAYIYGPWLLFLLPLLIRYVPGGALLAAAFCVKTILLPALRGLVELTRTVRAHGRQVLTPFRVLGLAVALALALALLHAMALEPLARLLLDARSFPP
jgi:hypothetical protein